METTIVYPKPHTLDPNQQGLVSCSPSQVIISASCPLIMYPTLRTLDYNSCGIVGTRFRFSAHSGFRVESLGGRIIGTHMPCKG